MVLFLQLSLSSCVVRKLVQVTPACIILTDNIYTAILVVIVIVAFIVYFKLVATCKRNKAGLCVSNN